jgi:cytoskeletal protein CcmA (bactofilin family)
MVNFCKSRRKWAIVLLLMLLGFVSVASHVEASDGMRGDRCVVAESDYIEEDFYFLCRILEIYGTIDGDLLGVASNITIERSGVVTGDVFAAGGKLVIAGTVGDDVRFGGVNLTVTDSAVFTQDRIDIASVALNTEIAEGVTIPGDLLVYGYQARLDGTVKGDIDFGGEALIIRGTVNGNVDASVGDARRSTDISGLPLYDVSFSNPGLRIEEGAMIGGDLVYQSASPRTIPPDVVQGSTQYEQILSTLDITKAEQADDAADILISYFTASLRDVFLLLVVGGLGLWLVPNIIRQPALRVRRRTVPAVGWGLITFMLSFPIVILLIGISLLILLFLLLIGLDQLTFLAASGLLLLINFSLVGAFGFVLVFLGRAVISFLIGQLIYRYVLRSPEPGTLRKWIITLALGGITYALITNVPLPPFGLIIELITILAGIGAVAMYARDVVYVSRLTPSPLRPVTLGIPTATTQPPPPPADYEVSPGMENLPEGFSGFDEDW